MAGISLEIKPVVKKVVWPNHWTLGYAIVMQKMLSISGGAGGVFHWEIPCANRKMDFTVYIQISLKFFYLGQVTHKLLCGVYNAENCI